MPLKTDPLAWLNGAARIPAAAVEQQLPRSSGVYAIFGDAKALPPPFRAALNTRPHPDLIYVGQASASLWQRVWNEEFHHKRPGTFFRSVGVMLGYVSPTGGRNFRFAPSDREAVTSWILTHLSIAWNSTMADDQITDFERHLIENSMPLLNIQGNPAKLPLLQQLRAQSQMGRTR